MRRRKYFKKKINKLSFVQKNILLIICCYVLVSLSSIGYAAFQKAINITGDLLLRAPTGVEISSLYFESDDSDGMELYNSRFTSDTASMVVNIEEVGDRVLYTMTLTNYGDTPMELTSLIPTFSVSDEIDCYMETDSVDFTTGYVLEGNSSIDVYIGLTRIELVSTTSTDFSLLIELEWEEYIPSESESEPEPNAPDLLNNSLVPVIYDGTNWVVADTTQLWYDYGEQIWANAVILEDGVTKNVGDTVLVPTEDSTNTEVRAMYVWIPRYEYKIEGTYGTHTDGTAGTASLPGEIEVNFIPTSQTSASSGYILHPAFQWDNDDDGNISASENIAGIWVGKFETSTETSSTCYNNPSDTNCSNGDQEPYILPNVKALTYQSVSNQFTTAQKFGTYLSNSSNIDSHMMKNSEWGAVAYLSQSSYGKYGNILYDRYEKKVDPNDTLITGYSDPDESWARGLETGIFGSCYEEDAGIFFCDDSDMGGISFAVSTKDISFIDPSRGKSFFSFDWDVTVGTDYYDEGLVFWMEDSDNNYVVEPTILNNALYENGELLSKSIEVELDGQQSEYYTVFLQYALLETNRGMSAEIRVDFNNVAGAASSTTGNIYGVYDMSGGAYDNVMGYLTTANSNYESDPNSYFGWTSSGHHAGFTSKPADKYFDAYTTEDSTTACNEGICYGHALSETSGWYKDSAYFVIASYPWFKRGGVYSGPSYAGVFYSGRDIGTADSHGSFRSVVLPTGA